MTFSSFISSELIRTCQLDIFLSPQSGHFIYLNLKMFANLQQSSVGDFIPKYATAFVQSDKYKYIISSLDVNKRQRKYRGGKKLSAVQICTVDGFISPHFLYVQNGSLIYLLWWPIKKCFSVRMSPLHVFFLFKWPSACFWWSHSRSPVRKMCFMMSLACNPCNCGTIYKRQKG